METIYSSEKSVDFHRTSSRYVSEDTAPQTERLIMASHARHWTLSCEPCPVYQAFTTGVPEAPHKHKHHLLG
jgi:hypothetical protein